MASFFLDENLRLIVMPTVEDIATVGVLDNTELLQNLPWKQAHEWLAPPEGSEKPVEGPVRPGVQTASAMVYAGNARTGQRVTLYRSTPSGRHSGGSRPGESE